MAIPAIIVNFLIALALQVVAYVLTPKPKGPKPEAARDLESPTASAGRGIKVIFGDVLLKDPNILWFGDKSNESYKTKA